MKHLFLFSILALTLFGCESQTIQGRVVDLFGQPIEGVTVAISNSGFSTTTDDEGQYRLDYAPSNEIVVMYLKSDTTQFQYDGNMKKVSIAEKCRYLMPDITLGAVPAGSRDKVWLMQDGTISEIPRTNMDEPLQPIAGPFTKIKREASIVFYFDRDRGKDELCYPMLLSVSDKTGRLVLNMSQPTFPFEGLVYDKITHVGVLLNVATVEHSEELPKGRYVLCLLDVKRGKIAGTYHGVEIE